MYTSRGAGDCCPLPCSLPYPQGAAQVAARAHQRWHHCGRWSAKASPAAVCPFCSQHSLAQAQASRGQEPLCPHEEPLTGFALPRARRVCPSETHFLEFRWLCSLWFILVYLWYRGPFPSVCCIEHRFFKRTSCKRPGVQMSLLQP